MHFHMFLDVVNDKSFSHKYVAESRF